MAMKHAATIIAVGKRAELIGTAQPLPAAEGTLADRSDTVERIWETRAENNST
jgi:hypothetical protein